MQIYLVGGAVRDSLLQRPIDDRDWVVVGATPEAMLRQGFIQVGKSFPVFLHPTSREQYALARGRNDSGGWHFEPTVGLEEDLCNRDLTINAMAMDAEGALIDPYQGRRDLLRRLLRPVSDGFSLDALRLLRTLRLAAQLAPLGFRISAELHATLLRMEADRALLGEPAERLWAEWQKGLLSPAPGYFIELLQQYGVLRRLLPEWRPPADGASLRLFRRRLGLLAGLDRDVCVRLAGWLVDLTMPRADPDLRRLAARLSMPEECRRAVVLAVGWRDLGRQRPTAEYLLDLLSASDALRRPWQLQNLLLVCRADRLAEGWSEHRVDLLCRWLEDCRQAVAVLDLNGVLATIGQPAQIKAGVRQARLRVIRDLLEYPGWPSADP